MSHLRLISKIQDTSRYISEERPEWFCYGQVSLRTDLQLEREGG